MKIFNQNLHKEVEDAVATKISFGQKFRAPDLRKIINNPNLTGADVAYGLSRMNRYGKVRIVGYEPSDKVPAGHLRIYEKAKNQCEEVSVSTDGSMLRLYEMIDKISTREDAESVYSYVRQRCVDLYLENLGNEIEKE